MGSFDQEILDAVHGRPSNHEGWVRVNCPYCPDRFGKEDKKRSLGFNVRSGIAHCFRCGAKTKIKSFIVEESSFEVAPPRSSVDEDLPELPPGYEPLWCDPGATAVTLAPARAYLVRRNVPPAFWAGARLGACGHGEYLGRIIVPILSRKLRLRGWVGRMWCDGVERPYHNMDGEWAGTSLFNEAALFKETDEPALVMEGCFDALPYWPDALGTLGKSVTDEQLDLLCQARRPLAMCLDGDAWEAGEMLALRVAFESSVRTGFVKLPPLTDPNDVQVSWLRERAKECIQ